MSKKTTKKEESLNKKSSLKKINLTSKNNLIYGFVALVLILSILFLFMNKKNNDCSVAINDYLKSADMVGNGAEVKNGDSIVVDYVGRFDEKEVFDTSVENVAKLCGKYMTGRDYSSGLPFTVGAGQMIAGFDKAVVGMKVGQTKTITLSPAEAYGERDESQVVTMEKSKVPNSDQYQVGMQLQTPYGQILTVTKITDTEITFDGNSEMAGKTLIFDITIKNIN